METYIAADRLPKLPSHLNLVCFSDKGEIFGTISVNQCKNSDYWSSNAVSNVVMFFGSFFVRAFFLIVADSTELICDLNAMDLSNRFICLLDFNIDFMSDFMSVRYFDRITFTKLNNLQLFASCRIRLILQLSNEYSHDCYYCDKIHFMLQIQ